MVFINWFFWLRVSLSVVAVGALIWVVRKGKGWKPIKRGLAYLTTLPLAAVGALILLAACLNYLEGCESYGTAIYSPDHRSAARVEYSDEGGTGGGTSVVVYRNRGLSRTVVLDAAWKAVTDSDLHWTDESHLQIRFLHWEGYDEMNTCRDSAGVQVRCFPRPTP